MMVGIYNVVYGKACLTSSCRLLTLLYVQSARLVLFLFLTLYIVNKKCQHLSGGSSAQLKLLLLSVHTGERSFDESVLNFITKHSNSATTVVDTVI